MRSYKLASLILLASGWSFACNDGGATPGDGDGDGGGDGDVGAAPGDGDGDGDGDVPGTGGGTGDGDGDGDAPSKCDNVVVATASSALIDDFNSDESFPQIPDSDDGRVGSWGHGHWIAPAGAQPLHQLDNDEGYIVAECTGDAAEHPWCNTAWDEANAWQQWASVDLAIALYSETQVNCYDASVFTGVKFKARSSAEGNSIRLQVSTPDANPDTGETYQSGEMQLPHSGEWEEFTVPFGSILQPSWSTITAPLDPGALRSISWVIRTRVDQTDEANMVIGETLAPYNVQLDDISFY